MKSDYLERILNARVYDVAQESPLEFAPNLSARLENKLLLKREDMQSVFSFKLRGAYNKMAQLPPEVLQQGVVAASSGKPCSRSGSLCKTSGDYCHYCDADDDTSGED